MKKLTPLVKGLITAPIMLGLTLFIFYSKQTDNSLLNYLIIVVFAAGIVWTLYDYRRSVNPDAKFGELFGQGFRCFIVVTLIMVTFTGIFSAAHPEFAEKDAESYREYLKKEDKDKTPDEQEKMVENYKKHYTTQLVSTAIFGYLVIGSLITAVGSVILLLRKK
jgi:vacuolar-type H+-ATPase subunit I/STV1